MKSRECKDQTGGGACLLCKSPGTVQTTCPLNQDAVDQGRANPAKHPNAVAILEAREAEERLAEDESGENFSDPSVPTAAASANDWSAASFAASYQSSTRPVQSVTARPVQSVVPGPVQSVAASAATSAPSTTNSISIFISGHGSEDQTDMFFQDTNPEFITLKNKYSYISDMIHNVHMISQVGRWGGSGICFLPLNQSEMTISQDFFVRNPSSTPYEIMQGLSRRLTEVLPEHIKFITDKKGSTTTGIIIQYVKTHQGQSELIIKDLLVDQFEFKKINTSLEKFIRDWIALVSRATSAFTPGYLLSQLLIPLNILEEPFVEAWRTKLEPGYHNMAASSVRGTTYSLIRPCIDKVYGFKPIAEEPHSGIHVLDIRIDGIPLDLNQDILTDTYNLLFSNRNSFDNGLFNETSEKLQGELIEVNLPKGKKEQTISLSTIIASFKELGFNEIYIIDNSCRGETIGKRIGQHGEAASSKALGEIPFRQKLTRCEDRVPRIGISSNSNSKCEGESRGILSGLRSCTISGGNLKLHDDCAPYAADIIIKYLNKTYQNGTDKLQKQSLQFIVSLFGKNIIQYLDNRKNTLSTLRDIMINKYFNADQHWRKKAYLICKDY